MDKYDEAVWKGRQQEWGVAFVRALDASGQTRTRAAEAAGISTEQLRKWVGGKPRLDPRRLAALADSVGANVYEWAYALGFIPDDLRYASLQIEDLRRDARRAETALASLRAQGHGAGTVVAATVRGGGWRASTHSVWSGPTDCRLRIGDVVKIGKSDRSPCYLREILADPEIAPALAAAGAVYEAGVLFGTEANVGADLERDRMDWWSWLVPALNAVRPRTDLPLRPTIGSIAVVTCVRGTRFTDVASLIALALGFASTTTGALARFSLGEVANVGARDVAGSAAARESIAADLLAHPEGIGRDLVWAYSSLSSVERISRHLEADMPSPIVIYLRPTDALLQQIDPRDSAGVSRQLLDEAVGRTKSPVVALDAGLPVGAANLDQMTNDTRDLLTERNLFLAAEALERLHAEFEGPPLEHLHESMTGVRGSDGKLRSSVDEDGQLRDWFINYKNRRHPMHRRRRPTE